MRKCWTCLEEHDIDAPCRASGRARTVAVAGAMDDLFEPADDGPVMGPIFKATYDSRCAEGDWITEGEDIRADGHGGYVHADSECDGSNA